ncbi:T9SS type A sorting domain-containing protein [Algoriphagus limi]|uniref:T9SS type A sorting domain-containing protein n=1 Tax=Algoriphagus limi TaxID=2975273 RepID=A0ABT2G5Z5_9BACT|nr:T9SS type A sorting domain-containing protein [Algoriphagus limi]MCS5490542.1 T9SS type A sorting domain-containing protein [Algoriphagus limi]
MRSTLFLLLFLHSVLAFGQTTFSLSDSPSILENGQTLPAAWSGGINSAQIQTIDLNGDEIEEWIIWDINSRQLSVFEKSGESFTLRPEWAYYFPSDISGFLVLADFDLDGKKDLFTSTALGIKVYKNTSTQNEISWELERNFLPLDNGSNIQANNLDTPLIRDLDRDGDLDLAIFNFASGDYLEFYENTSVDRTGTPDLDGFAFPKTHWGNFEFCACGDISFGKTCSGLDLSQNPSENLRIQHAGGHSILYQDFTGDGIPDMLLGRDECQILYFLPNKGTEEEPLFDEFSNSLLDFGPLPQFPSFHNASWVDDQLVISLNSNETATIYGIDYESSVFLFNGNTTPFLQDQVLDLGENSRPFFKGNQNGGELWITSNVTREGEVLGELASFSFQNGEFDLSSRNQELRELNLTEIQYLEYSDLQNNSHKLISGIRFEGNIPEQVLFRFLEGTWQEASLTGYEPNRGDFLQFFSFENQEYLLVARQNGGLDLYEMNWDSFSAQLEERDFLGFQDNPANRNLSISVQQGEQPNLYAVDQRGIVVFIENFMENSQRGEVKIRIGNLDFPTRLGRNTWIALVPNLLGENPDLILGTRGGGLIYLSAGSSSSPPSDSIQVLVYPNPSDGHIKVISNQNGKGRLISAMGQVLLSDISINAGQELEIQAGFLTPGLYIFQLEAANRSMISKKIWIR